MASKRRVVNSCYFSDCEKEGRWEVFDRWNSSYGKFCGYHADSKVKELSAREANQEMRHGGGV